MAKKRRIVESLCAVLGAASTTDEEIQRDFVTFYARLTYSLEIACGRETLSARLVELRRNTRAENLTDAELNALSRFFQRLNQSGAPLHHFTDFIKEFIRHTAAAVSRPEHHVRQLLSLFVMGDDDLHLRPICGATPLCHSCQLTRECDAFNIPRKPEMAVRTAADRLLASDEMAISDAELLGVFLFGEHGTGNEEVVQTLINRYGWLRAIFRADAHEFLAIRNMSNPQAIRLASMAAIHRRLMAERRNQLLRITCAKDIHDRYEPELRDYRVEVAVLLMLDGQNQVIRDAWFGDNSPNVAHINIATLLRPAIREMASRVALVHNHPSNDPSPSLADMEYTKRLRQACDLVGLTLVDHVIVAEAKFYSFAEAGML